MKAIAAITISLFALSACTSGFLPLSETPAANEVLSNARRAANQLDSYRATRIITETTHYPQSGVRDVPRSTQQTIEVASSSDYRVIDHAFRSEMVRTGGNSYMRSSTGEWEMSTASEIELETLPGEKSWPSSHPMKWLNRRVLTATVFVGERTLSGTPAYVVEAQVPMFPLPAPDNERIPADDVRLYIDKETFHVLRIEIDHNIRDSLREDTGYQVIPGLVEIETVEVIDYSDHNEDLEIEIPRISPAVQGSDDAVDLFW